MERFNFGNFAYDIVAVLMTYLESFIILYRITHRLLKRLRTAAFGSSEPYDGRFNNLPSGVTSGFPGGLHFPIQVIHHELAHPRHRNNA